MDEEDKTDGVTIRDSIGRDQTPVLINESGLYSLILSSKMPNARRFKRWVTSEILPTIRKHGMYATDELIANPNLAIAAFTALKEEREKNRLLEQTTAVQKQQIAEMKPKASYYDVILNCKDLISTSTVAKDYGKSAIWMNRYLHAIGVAIQFTKSVLMLQETSIIFVIMGAISTTSILKKLVQIIK